MAAQAATPVDQGKWGTSLVFGSSASTKPRKAPARIELEPIAVPQWARQPAPPEARPPRPLAPSAIAEDREPAAAPSAAARAAARRGTLIHLLLERLAAVDPPERHICALRWLERSAGLKDETERQEIADQVCRVLSDPEFAPLFGEESFGEAPLAATLPDGRVIAGTVDRLLVEASRVSVLDFKTGRVPEDAVHIPAAHRAQMRAYVEALQVIFPGREVTAALLYTAGPKLIELMP
jgi:ATP-dependent helicase/nuclease subunit A